MMGSWQAGPVTIVTKAIHIRVMKTTSEAGSVNFSTKYCSSNLKHDSFDLYEQHQIFYWVFQTSNEQG
jgi:hypothetical protein